MTALVFFFEPERLCLAMDTCCHEIDANGNRSPGPFCSKIQIIPHFHLAVCGTGVRSLVYHWSAFLQENAVARDVTELDNLAHDFLPKVALRCRVTDKLTSTIYHFGYSPMEERLLGFAYRSSDNFSGEEITYGLGVKPPDGVDLNWAFDLCERKGLPNAFVEIMTRQKCLDEAESNRRSVGIGGEIQFLVVDKEGFSIRTCHRFDDYDKHYDFVRSRCQDS